MQIGDADDSLTAADSDNALAVQPAVAALSLNKNIDNHTALGADSYIEVSLSNGILLTIANADTFDQEQITAAGEKRMALFRQ